MPKVTTTTTYSYKSDLPENPSLLDKIISIQKIRSVKKHFHPYATFNKPFTTITEETLDDCPEDKPMDDDKFYSLLK